MSIIQTVSHRDMRLSENWLVLIFSKMKHLVFFFFLHRREEIYRESENFFASYEHRSRLNKSSWSLGISEENIKLDKRNLNSTHGKYFVGETICKRTTSRRIDLCTCWTTCCRNETTYSKTVSMPRTLDARSLLFLFRSMFVSFWLH